MTLSDWLDQEGISPTDFGKRIGRPQATIQRYVTGKRIPEPDTMALIVEETKGAVTPNDFYGVSSQAQPAGAS